jgi:ribosomal protein S18 acetylase RimI-like enzyme
MMSSIPHPINQTEQQARPEALPAPTASVAQIRLATKRDRGVIRGIECACFGRVRFLFGLWSQTGERHATTWVAEVEGRLVGYLIAYPNALSGRRTMYVGGVGVSPQYRQGGIGTQLMKAAMDAHHTLWLHVRAGNAAAYAMYRKLGMRELRRIPQFYSNGENAVVMGTPDLLVSAHAHLHAVAGQPMCLQATEASDRRRAA